MVLDGAIDPALSITEMVDDQAVGSRAGSTTSSCGARGAELCVAAERGSDRGCSGSSRGRRARPCRGRVGSRPARGPLSRPVGGVGTTRTGRSWRGARRGGAWQRYRGGDHGWTLRDRRLQQRGRGGAAIDCLDHLVDRDAADYPALAARAAAMRPSSGRSSPGACLPALVAGPADPSPMPASHPGAPPILLTGATGDPATPYQWAVNLAAAGPWGARHLVGDSHVTYYYSGCVRAIDQAYLVDGSSPAPGTGAPIEDARWTSVRIFRR